MDIGTLLAPDAVVPHMKATSKKQALQELSRRASVATGVDERRIVDVLLERERLGSTGVGFGIAIPHARLGEIDKLFGMFARLETPIGFDAVVWIGAGVYVVAWVVSPMLVSSEDREELAEEARFESADVPAPLG